MKQLYETIRNKSLRASAYRTIVLTAVAVLVAGVAIASVFAQSVAIQNDVDYSARLTQEADLIRAQTSEVLNNYGSLLRAGVAQLKANPAMTQEEWRQFAMQMQLQEEYPSLVGFGYVERLDAEEAMRKNVWPAGEREDYARIAFLEPQSDANVRAVGYDMYSDPVRKEAMTRARDTALPIMSKAVSLVKDTASDVSFHGVQLYYPLYKSVETPTTVDERKEQLLGYTYLVVRPKDIIISATGESSQMGERVDVTLTEVDDNILLYSRINSDEPANTQAVITKDITAYGQTWRVRVSGRDKAINEYYGPLGLFFLGTIVSALSAAAVYYVLLSRLSRVEKAYEEDVENTKSELLALASHQLRTPASGVKQYLGMLKDGSFGALTPAQQRLVEKSYATNERQLHVINDLLYVSKVESGQLQIEPVPCDIRFITEEVVANSALQAAQKNIRIVCSAKKPHKIIADDRYVTMIIENLISNAIKYSHDDATVRVRVSSRDGAVIVTVRDNGVGIDKKDFERIFEKFDRVYNPLSHKEGGTGLGLFLACQLARGHGGDIVVESVLGKGSTFTLTLPKTAMVDRAIVSLKGAKKRSTRVER
ncbi:hypothetical protein EOL96_00820 [Candidatus Saccharibacteria bacterium]|nr:hypothetical protein [Candidatus Saccharibacteria bacterium]